MVVMVLFVVSLAQAGISYTIGFGALRVLLPKEFPLLVTALVALRGGLIALLVVLWILNRKRALFRAVIVVNGLFTVALLGHTGALVDVLFGFSSHAIDTLMLDVVLMALSNILLFSIWYWIIDPPGSKRLHAQTRRGSSSFRSAEGACRATNRGCPGTRITCSSPSRPVLRSARRMHCRSRGAPRC